MVAKEDHVCRVAEDDLEEVEAGCSTRFINLECPYEKYDTE
jgi:hypothetical protein